MCTAGPLLSDFCVGRDERPFVPALIERSLTQTIDGTWVIWAHKVARRAPAGQFGSLATGQLYPTDAAAICLHRPHRAPQPDCSCGFHAVSDARDVPVVGATFRRSSVFRRLEVVL